MHNSDEFFATDMVRRERWAYFLDPVQRVHRVLTRLHIRWVIAILAVLNVTALIWRAIDPTGPWKTAAVIAAIPSAALIIILLAAIGVGLIVVITHPLRRDTMAADVRQLLALHARLPDHIVTDPHTNATFLACRSTHAVKLARLPPPGDDGAARFVAVYDLSRHGVLRTDESVASHTFLNPALIEHLRPTRFARHATVVELTQQLDRILNPTDSATPPR